MGLSGSVLVAILFLVFLISAGRRLKSCNMRDRCPWPSRFVRNRQWLKYHGSLVEGMKVNGGAKTTIAL